ncbi:Uncharacterized protein PECH_008838 [Penicillium ucsense]|uniref:Allergen Asp f 4 n=1 Tax=Penicillium ucsense TaxID=2839758 RepID=A0A8J8WMM3_9EURO|nr:Uncharacterized protein PECM_001507 [Penicillium ucsense]KAF7733900.1 Uncharacterized protein PECH_008838 [Penicillium ucsense]
MRVVSLFLLVTWTTSVSARHGHQGRHEGHLRRQNAASTVTLTTTNTVYDCAAPLSTSSIDPATISNVIQMVVPVTDQVGSTSTSSDIPVVIPTSSSTVAPPSVPTSSIASQISTVAAAHPAWTAVPPNKAYCTDGFGAPSKVYSGSGDTYVGNVGSPYGSNIIEVSGSDANRYKHVIQFQGSKADDLEVVIWNKIGPDGKMDGWYGNACHNFTLPAGGIKYYAFDSNTQGGFAAAKGAIPLNTWGSYAATWGEFDFDSTINTGWSGFDVSIIQAQNAGLEVQGMKICSVLSDGTCSTISKNAQRVTNAYTAALADEGGIGGNLVAGPVRLAAALDYCD